MKITNPELKVVRFNADDVIATSALLGLSRRFYIDNGQGGYQEFSGTFTSYSNGVYVITPNGSFEDVLSSDRENLMSGGDAYFPDMGVPVPGFDMAPIARQYYDATFNGGVYYSDGVSYYDEYWNQ